VDEEKCTVCGFEKHEVPKDSLEVEVPRDSLEVEVPKNILEVNE
jgi:hypothetical protein